jgi:Subunit ChlI of Mg-chelatase
VFSAQRKTPWQQLEAVVVLGELALDGRVRPVRGVLPAVLAAKGGGWKAAVVPAWQCGDTAVAQRAGARSAEHPGRRPDIAGRMDSGREVSFLSARSVRRVVRRLGDLRLATVLADRPAHSGQEAEFGVDRLEVTQLPKPSGRAGARKPPGAVRQANTRVVNYPCQHRRCAQDLWV